MNSEEYIINNVKVGNIILKKLYNKEEDYTIVKNILTDKELMKTSTIFSRDIARNKYDIDKVFRIFTSLNNFRNRDNIANMFKIYNIKGEILGIAGFTPLFKSSLDVLEYGILLKKNFQSLHIGTDISEFLLKNIHIKNIIITAFTNNLKSVNIFKYLNYKLYTSFTKNKESISVYAINDYKVKLLIKNLLTHRV